MSSLVLKLRIPHALRHELVSTKGVQTLDLSGAAERADHWYVFMLQLRVAMMELQRDVPLAMLQFDIYPRDLPLEQWPCARSLIPEPLTCAEFPSSLGSDELSPQEEVAARAADDRPERAERHAEGEVSDVVKHLREGTAVLLLEGHLIRSAFLSRVLIEIHRARGQFRLLDLLLGRKPLDNPSEGRSAALLLVTMRDGREALRTTVEFLAAMAKQENALKDARVQLSELVGDDLTKFSAHMLRWMQWISQSISQSPTKRMNDTACASAACKGGGRKLIPRIPSADHHVGFSIERVIEHKQQLPVASPSLDATRRLPPALPPLSPMTPSPTTCTTVTQCCVPSAAPSALSAPQLPSKRATLQTPCPSTPVAADASHSAHPLAVRRR